MARSTQFLRNAIGPLIGLVLVASIFAILRPATFLTYRNAEVMLLQTAVVGIAALGMTLVIIAGGIDLSVGSAIALISVALALLLPHTVVDENGQKHLSAGLPPVLAALSAVGTGALCGLLIGTLVARLKLAPFIVTLGMWGAFRGAAKGLANEKFINPTDTWLNDLLATVGRSRSWMLFPPGVWMMLILAVIVALMLRYTRFGRHIFAIGSNEQTARLCGVNVDLTKTLIYTVAGIFTGLAGLLQFSHLSGGDPSTAVGMELNIIAAVVIGGASLSGGQGSVLGTIIGALIMTILANGCTKMGWANWVQEIVTGCIIVLAVAIDRFRQRIA